MWADFGGCGGGSMFVGCVCGPCLWIVEVVVGGSGGGWGFGFAYCSSESSNDRFVVFFFFFGQWGVLIYCSRYIILL